jgi:transmembrane sensor
MEKKDIKSIELYRYFSGQSSDDEIASILAWLEKNYANQQEFILQKKLFIESGLSIADDQKRTNEAFQEFIHQIAVTEDIQENKNPGYPWIYPLLRYAAVITILLSASLAFLYIWKGQQYTSGIEEFYEIEAPYGSKTSIRLPDGSRIMLNAGSKLTYNKDFGFRSREIHLEGEAYFNVEKHRFPMIVNTSHIAVKVLGTEFNIKSYPDEDFIETTLVEGAIHIESIVDPNVPVIMLQPNERILYYKPRHEIQERVFVADNYLSDTIPEIAPAESIKPFRLTRNVDVSTTVSWKDGKYLFRGESLENLAVILSRRFDVSITFEDEEVKNYTYSGTIGDFPIEQVLDALTLTSPITYRIKEKNVFLSLDPRSASKYKRVIKNLN